MRAAACFAAFVFSAAAATGIGGGGLFTLCTVLLYGVPQFEAQGINLFVFVFAAVPASVYHVIRNGADLRIPTFLSFCGCAGCLIGSLIAAGAARFVLRYVFGAFSFLTGAAVLIGQIKEAVKKSKGTG